jgi:hypothetical protein
MAFGFSILSFVDLRFWPVETYSYITLKLRVSFIIKDIRETEYNIIRNYRTLMICTYHRVLMLDNRFKFVAAVLEEYVVY